MSSCRCCLTPHPLRLIERLKSSIYTIKLIRQNCKIFENILLDQSEHFERIFSNLNKYLMHYGIISNIIFTYLSQLLIQINNHLEKLRNSLYEIQCLTLKCSIWLKNLSNNPSLKHIQSQLKYYGKQLDNKFSKNFDIFQLNYQQQCLQMDSIEREHMILFIESIKLFSFIISSEWDYNLISRINIDQNINQWKEKNKFHISWIPDEHDCIKNTHPIESLKESSSDVEIIAIEDCSNDTKEKCAYESNLSWSFTIGKKEEDISITSSLHHLSLHDHHLPLSISHQTPIENPKPHQPIINDSKSPSQNRVRLAIEAIERNK